MVLAKMSNPNMPTETMVCGPVCFVNLLDGLRRSGWLPPANPHDVLHRIIYHYPSSLDIDRTSIFTDGLDVQPLLKIMSWYLQEAGIRTSFEAVGTEATENSDSIDGIHDRTSISPEHLQFKPNEAVIINFEHWNLDEPQEAEISPNEHWRGGHYVLLTNVKRINDEMFHVKLNDPLRGQTSADLVLITHKKLGIDTFLVRPHFDLYTKQKITLVTNVIRLSFFGTR